MKITLFTSNNIRHSYFINLLSKICKELFVVQECGTIFPGEKSGHYQVSEVIKNYFLNVQAAQTKIFGKNYIFNLKNNVKILPMLLGDLNKCSIGYLSDFLRSDFYIVFGSSYIKGDLVNFLIKKKAINIHMGISPFYRGCDCNFWALYDDNPHLVGATIHLLSKGLDSGPILYHALSKVKTDPFEYTMSSVKSAFHSITERIKNKTIFQIKHVIQNKDMQIRYTKSSDFNEKVVLDYFKKKINLNKKKFDDSLLKNPFYLENI